PVSIDLHDQLERVQRRGHELERVHLQKAIAGQVSDKAQVAGLVEYWYPTGDPVHAVGRLRRGKRRDLGDAGEHVRNKTATGRGEGGLVGFRSPATAGRRCGGRRSAIRWGCSRRGG